MRGVSQIIWSKNRAMQLDALLRSSVKNAGIENKNTYIVYDYSDDIYGQGYDLAMSRFRDYAYFIKQRDFKKDIIDVLNIVNTKYVLGNSDDNIFINPAEFYGMQEGDHAYSLRLYPGIVYCNPAKLTMKTPDFIYRDYTYCKWDWTQCNPRGCWGYPNSCDSNIYRTEEFLDNIKKAEFNNPSNLEAWLNDHRPFKCIMVCNKKPSLISIENNVVSSTSTNESVGWNIEELNKKLLNGYIIDSEKFYGIKKYSCHIKENYEFIKYDKNSPT